MGSSVWRFEENCISVHGWVGGTAPCMIIYFSILQIKVLSYTTIYRSVHTDHG